MQTAAYWKKTGEAIQCELCPHYCRILSGRTGRCGIRRNADGTLIAETYGLISSLAMDPVEKKPLFHVKPGREILSVGSAGCNFHCSFCQNWQISQRKPKLSKLAPSELVALAVAQKACGVAYTYNEPIVNFEYVMDCARLTRQKGLLNVMVTNGFINPEPLQELLPWIDAWNIDVKSIRPEFYRQVCGGELPPVLETVSTVARVKYVELTHLVVTDGNDREEEFTELIDWIASISSEIPLHITRYFPQYRRSTPATDLAVLCRVREIARQKLTWVYIGNVEAEEDSTYCPDCRTLLIPRQGYQVGRLQLKNGSCPQCGRKVPGVF